MQTKCNCKYKFKFNFKYQIQIQIQIQKQIQIVNPVCDFWIFQMSWGRGTRPTAITTILANNNYNDTTLRKSTQATKSVNKIRRRKRKQIIKFKENKNKKNTKASICKNYKVKRREAKYSN